MATIYIENKPYPVRDGQNLLHACLGLGFDIPYFCWHPALGSIGSCRVCAVKQYRGEEDTNGKIVMSCTTPAKDGTRISIRDPEVVAFRASMIELLMINHPHDCPVCDEGGECHLQDMTVMSGHNTRRHRFTKRTFPNQNLGPFIHHEMNRCIQCYRCVRFYNDHADGSDLQPLGSRNNVYFGRLGDGKLENSFSGNLVEICPTGVFTDKPTRERPVRKWDLQTAPGICGLCSLGCNTIPAERGGILRRILNRYHSAVNGYFICDRGRYGYGFVNSERRIRAKRIPATATSDGLKRVIAKAKGIVGIGSPRASLEANFAVRSLVGAENFSNGLAAADAEAIAALIQVLDQSGAKVVSLAEVAAADSVLILGEDIANTAPMLELAVRQAVHRYQARVAPSKAIADWDSGSRKLVQTTDPMSLNLLSPAATGIDELARRRLSRAPADIARIGFAIAQTLDHNAPAVSGLSADDELFVREVSAELAQAERPLVISGTGLLNKSLIESAGNVANALAAKQESAGIYLTATEANSLGAGLMSDLNVDQAISAVTGGRADTVIVLENDLYRRVPRTALEKLRKSAATIVVLDSLYNETTQLADWLLPVGTPAEISGSYLSSEGRLQRYYNNMPSGGDVKAAWEWLQVDSPDNAKATPTLDRLAQNLADAIPALAGLAKIAPGSDYRLGQRKIARMSPRSSGRGSMTADRDVSEVQIPQDSETPFTYSMEGASQQPPAALVPRYWAPGWNSVQALYRFQEEISGVMKGGEAGVRVFNERKSTPSYFNLIPEPFTASDEEFAIVPLYRIFGSDERSMSSKAIQEVATDGFLVIATVDAARLGLEHDGLITIINAADGGDRSALYTLLLQVDAIVAPGVAGLYCIADQGETVDLAGKPAATVAALGTGRVKLVAASAATSDGGRVS